MRIKRINEKDLKAIDISEKMIEKAWGVATERATSEGLVASATSPVVQTGEEGELLGLTAAGELYVTEMPRGTEFAIDVLIPEEVESGDGRTFKRGAITKVDGPLPLLWQQYGQRGHDGSMIVGRIDHVERLDIEEAPEGIELAVEEASEGEVKYGWGRAYGVFDTGPYALEAARLVNSGFLTKISADMDKFEAQTETSTAAAETDEDGVIKNDKMTVNKARLIAATLVSKPAFQETSIRIVEPSFDYIELPVEDGMYEEEYEDEFAVSAAITASAAPLEPPAEWFGNPGLGGPTPIEVDSDGRVYGHIATWSTDHIGLPRGTKPPRSRSNYAYFRTGVVRTDSGKDVPVGQLTLAGGHASMSASAEEAIKHYDDTASAVADVAAGEDAYGIWVAGALRPSVTGEQVRALRASAPSGDWRVIGGRLELVAVCQVNVPGFPTARAMVASGQAFSLVAAGARPLAEMRHASLEDRLADLEKKTYSVEAQEFQNILDGFLAAEQESLLASAKPAVDFLEDLSKTEKEKRDAQAASLREILDNLF